MALGVGVGVGVGAVRARLAAPLPEPLARWAHDLADPAGDTPLLGTGLRAARYPALLWNGARCAGSAPVVAGLLCGDRGRSVAELGQAVAAGEAVVSAARAAQPPGPAEGTLDALGCAVVITLLSTPGRGQLTEVIDQAAALMVLAPSPRSDGAASGRVDLIRAGHPVAAGWLACRAVEAGLTVPSGTAQATLATIAGSSLRPAPATPATVGALCDTLR